MTDKAKLYIVRNDDGEYLMDPAFAAWFPDWTDDITTADLYEHKEAAEETANECDSYVVELLEAPAKVVVSEEEAEMLEQAKDDYCAASVISSYSTEHIGAMGQDRLMRAYVNGWTVEKPKRWNVKVPKKGSGDDKHYWAKENDGALTWAYLISKDYMIPAQQFTAAEIEHYGLQDCERVEVCADNARTTGEVTDDEQ